MLAESEDTVTTAAFARKQNKKTRVAGSSLAASSGSPSFLSFFGRGRSTTGAKSAVPTTASNAKDGGESAAATAATAPLGGAWTI
jgi:hypothetical protein